MASLSLPAGFDCLFTSALILRHETFPLLEPLLVTIFREFSFEHSECSINIAPFDEHLNHVIAFLSNYFPFAIMPEQFDDIRQTHVMETMDGL